MNKEKKKMLFSFIVVLILFFIGLSVFLGKIFNSNKDVKLTDDMISLTVSSSESINIKSMLPLKDEVGIKIKNSDYSSQSYYDFSIKSNTDKDVRYEVFLVSGDNNTIDNKFIKVYLTNEKDEPFDYYKKNIVPVFSDLSFANTDPSGKVIYQGIIKSGETNKYRLRMWLSDVYVIGTEVNTFSAGVKVNVF